MNVFMFCFYILPMILSYLIIRMGINEGIMKKDIELILVVLYPFINAVFCVIFLCIFCKENSHRIAELFFLTKKNKKK